jgi:hypothetical protein
VSGCGSGNASVSENGCRGAGNGDGGAQATASASESVSCCGRDACALVARDHGCDRGLRRLSEPPEQPQRQSRLPEPPQRAVPDPPLVAAASASAILILLSLPRVFPLLVRSCCLKSGLAPQRNADQTTNGWPVERWQRAQHREHTRRGGEGGGGEADTRRGVAGMRLSSLPSVLGSVARSGILILSRCGRAEPVEGHERRGRRSRQGRQEGDMQWR